MNITNKTGPRTDPWGIPLVTSSQDDPSPFTITLFFLPSRKAFIHAGHFHSLLALPVSVCVEQCQKHF